jgi:hypothetical protein
LRQFGILHYNWYLTIGIGKMYYFTLTYLNDVLIKFVMFRTVFNQGFVSIKCLLTKKKRIVKKIKRLQQSTFQTLKSFGENVYKEKK